MSALKKYENWLLSPTIDDATKEELADIRLDEKEIEERFACYLSFGTAGLRGVMAAGINRMNVYTVRHATQGYAQYLVEKGLADRGVVIAWDSRLNSELFARETACVLAAHGVKVMMFPALRPTPELSYAIRKLGAAGGVNVTASHNPKQYNGYKAYSSDGAQLSPEEADAVAAKMAKIDILKDIVTCDYDTALAEGKITILDSSIDEGFMENILAQSVNPEAIAKLGDELKIVYTPLNGTGATIFPELIRRAGLTKLYTVEEQMTPDGNFPTTDFPNPEFPQVFEKGIAIAERIGADLIVANDPDADRTGIMIRGRDGKFITVNGNRIGALLAEYIAGTLSRRGKLPKEAYIVKSIVSTEIVGKICENYGVDLHNTLTGFKFIGGVITDKEEAGCPSENFLLGFEESNGYMRGGYLRDKDGMCASMLLCELAATLELEGKSMIDALEDLDKKYGLYAESTENIYMQGLDGLEKMKKLMDTLRTQPPVEIGGEKVAVIRDYLSGEVKDLRTGALSETGLEKSNVLYYITENDNVIVIRPSGTEPKIKVYLLLHSSTGDRAELNALLDRCKESTKEWMKLAQ